MGLHRFKRMKIKLAIFTEDGRSYEGEAQLTPIGSKKSKSGRPQKIHQTTSSDREFDFTLPLRAFVTVNGARKLSGPQKFTLLLGGLTKGDTSASVDIDRVQKEWNKMTAPMGDGSIPHMLRGRKTRVGWSLSSKECTNCDPRGARQFHPKRCHQLMQFLRLNSTHGTSMP